MPRIFLHIALQDARAPRLVKIGSFENMRGIDPVVGATAHHYRYERLAIRHSSQAHRLNSTYHVLYCCLQTGIHKLAPNRPSDDAVLYGKETYIAICSGKDAWQDGLADHDALESVVGAIADVDNSEKN